MCSRQSRRETQGQLRLDRHCLRGSSGPSPHKPVKSPGCSRDSQMWRKTAACRPSHHAWSLMKCPLNVLAAGNISVFLLRMFIFLLGLAEEYYYVPSKHLLIYSTQVFFLCSELLCMTLNTYYAPSPALTTLRELAHLVLTSALYMILFLSCLFYR